MTAPLDRERLAKLLGMCGSDHDGEVVNAARAADRLIRDAGLRWPEVLAPVPMLPEPTRHTTIESVEDAIELCLDYSEYLTDWETKFITSLRRRRSRALSDKQLMVLDKLVTKIQRAGSRAAA